MHQIDASFRERKQQTAARRRQGMRRRWISGVLGLLVLALGTGFWLTRDQWSFNAGKDAEPLGEAGPEAVLPLTRGSDGRLGVSAGGGSVNVTFNVTANDARSFMASEAELSAMLLRAVKRGTRAS